MDGYWNWACLKKVGFDMWCFHWTLWREGWQIGRGGGNDAPHDGIRMKEKCQFCFRFDRQQQIIPDIKREGFYGAHEARSAIPHCCCGRCRCRCHCQLSRDSRCPRTQWSTTVFSSRLITLRYCYSYDTLYTH